ncbi:MAG: PorV/PorQ family protein [candidate division WOR-3 bacterium]|jgi:hypothetical protein
MNFILNIIISSARDASAPVLTIYPGAVATGMGGAFTAFSDDMSAIYYNPAGLANFKNISLFGWQHSNWLLGLIPDAYFEFGSFNYPTQKGIIGIGLTYLTIGEVEISDEAGNTYKFTPYDVVLSLGFGTEIQKDLKIGGSIKYFYSFLIPEQVLRQVFGVEGKGTAQVPAIDVGLLYKFQNFNFGASLLNIGPNLKYSGSETGEPLPITLRLGIGYYKEIGNVSFRTAGDVVKVLVNIIQDYNDSGLVWVVNEAFKHVGIELGIAKLIFLRFGYFHDYYGDRMGPTFGIGARYKGLRIDVSDDRMIYRFNKEGDSKPNIRFQLSYETERKIIKDTIPKFIVEVFDSSNNLINNFDVEIYDSSWNSIISKVKGSNGKAIVEMPFGIYGIKILSRDYFENRDKIVFNKNAQKFKYILKQKGRAYISINIIDSLRNRPAYARISIDTLEMDTNTINLEIPEGTYALRISSIEYEDYYNIFEFKADSNYNLNIYLKPKLAYINLKLNKIAKVEIYKDGEILNSFEDSTKLIKLPVGNYKFLIIAQNYPKMEINYKIEEIKDTTLNINLVEYNQVFQFSSIDELKAFINQFPEENFLIEYYNTKTLQEIEQLKGRHEVKFRKSKENKIIVSFKNQKGG